MTKLFFVLATLVSFSAFATDPAATDATSDTTKEAKKAALKEKLQARKEKADADKATAE